MVAWLQDLLITWWQFTVVGILIIIGWYINLFGVDNKSKRIGFEYKEMPHMMPISIPTKGKGFWSAIWMWLTGSRQWIVAKDFNYKMFGNEYVIPKGFQFDGASIPKFLHTWLSPTGVLLMGGLVHDYAYKYAGLKMKGKTVTSRNLTSKTELHELDQKGSDQIFRDINIEINGFHFLNYLAYWALRIGGFVAWNGHRKND